MASGMEIAPVHLPNSSLICIWRSLSTLSVQRFAVLKALGFTPWRCSPWRLDIDNT